MKQGTTSTFDGGNPESGALVSVILPVYNAAMTLPKCISSLTSQIYSNLELIIVDDGSTDGSRQILGNLQASDPRIRFLSKLHTGVSDTRNRGFGLSRGEIIFFAEADAYYDQHYIDLAVRELNHHENVGGVCMMMGVWKNRAGFVTNCLEAEYVIKQRLARLGTLAPYFAWVFTRKALTRTGLYDTELSQGEDKDLFERVRKSGFVVAMGQGVHWWHSSDEGMLGFVKDSFLRGVRRVPYMRKHKLTRDLLKGIMPWVLLVVGLLASPLWFDILYVIALIAISGLLYLLVRVLALGWDSTAKRRYLFALPVLQLMRYVSTGIGYLAGVLSLKKRRT